MSQQLVKKGTNGKHENVMPRSWIEAIKDKNTGQTLVEILQGFNMYFLPYNGNTSSTRCLVPTILRKKGLWITYVKYDGNVYTEWYAADEIDDKSWGDSSNWRVGNNTLVGDITISANGNWVINGTETEFKAVGEKGNTPLLRVANNRLQVSYNLGEDYMDVTNNPVYTKFRWLGTTGDTQNNIVGRIQSSTDEGKTWTNMSNDFTNNLHIKKYIGANESLPTSGIAEGTIYAKGPYYAEDDTLNDNPIYRLWVYAWKGNTLAWQDNGEFQSIAAGVVQETGDSETEVMSQAAVTRELSELASKFLIELFDITHTPTSAASSRIEIGRTLKAGNTYNVIIEYDFKVGYLASIGASLTLNGGMVDTIATIYSNIGQLEVHYIPSVDVNGLYINPASNYEYNAESFVKIKIIQEATLNDIDDSVEDVKKFAEKGIDDANKKTDNVGDRTSFFEELLGKNFRYSNINAYSDVEVGFVLKEGSVIKNNGVPLIFAEDESFNGRQDISTNGTMVLNSDKHLVRVLNITGDVDFSYEPVETVDGKILKSDSISGSQLMNNAVTVEKTTFFGSVNLIDLNDADVVFGAYLQSWGGLSENSAYNTTGFIPVKEDTTYYIGSLDVGVGFVRMLGFYDKYKTERPIQYLQDITASFVAPKGAAYVRLTIGTNGWDKSQLTENEMKNYSTYKIALKNEYMPNGSGNGGNGKDLFFYLPKDIYVAAGRTIELYYEQILLGASRYNIKATCSVGKALERKFQIIGNASKIGTYTLTINVYDDSGNYVIGGTSNVHIVSSDINKAVKVLPIGDSLTNDKPWLSELTKLNSNITTIGTRRKIHEGRSGCSVADYTNVSGGAIYNYDNYYSGTGSAAELFSETKSYGEGEIVRIATTVGNGQSGYNVYVFTSAHSAGAWNGNDAYCINKGNPFYDFNNNKFSMNFYKSFQNIDYNTIMIYLGTNGISLTPETNRNGALGIKNLIELIRQEDTTSPIVVVNTIFRSGQNGIGNQGNTDGYKAQSAYKFEEDKKVLLLGKALEEMIGGMDNVYLCPVGFTHDSKYNFGNTHVAVNPRLAQTTEVYELQPLDSVHPQECGYLQMADEMFSTICAIVNK